MTALDFPAHLNDQTHVILNINDTLDARATLGQRAADGVAKVMGSWRFIIVQTVLLSLWIALNVTAYVNHWAATWGLIRHRPAGPYSAL